MHCEVDLEAQTYASAGTLLMIRTLCKQAVSIPPRKLGQPWRNFFMCARIVVCAASTDALDAIFVWGPRECPRSACLSRIQGKHSSMRTGAYFRVAMTCCSTEMGQHSGKLTQHLALVWKTFGYLRTYNDEAHRRDQGAAKPNNKGSYGPNHQNVPRQNNTKVLLRSALAASSPDRDACVQQLV
jgi:hypothetical protein